MPPQPGDDDSGARGFNPRPASRSGDAQQPTAVVDAYAVSIRARPHGRAMRSTARDPPRRRAFQSAPGLTVGRCHCAMRCLFDTTGFNPRPASRSGDALDRKASCSSPSMFQSAPGLTVGRCDHPIAHALHLHPFQSAPGLTVGRCAELVREQVVARHVSIRARPHGRAMRFAVVAVLQQQRVSIRARPHGRAMQRRKRLLFLRW